MRAVSLGSHREVLYNNVQLDAYSKVTTLIWWNDEDRKTGEPFNCKLIQLKIHLRLG